MNVSLTPELEKFVLARVESGMYQTSSEVIREGLRLLAAREEQKKKLNAEIQVGLDQLARAEFLTESELNEHIKRRRNKKVN